MNAQATRETTSLQHTNLPAPEGTYDQTRGIVDKIILHTESPTMGKEAHLSMHYIVHANGTITAQVPESLTAYHSGQYFVHQTSIGITHEDAGDPNSVRTDDMYHASAMLIFDLCKFYGIQITRERILRHSEVSLKGSSCPDSLHVDRIVEEAARLDAEKPVTTQDLVREEATASKELLQESVKHVQFLSDRVKELEGQVTTLEGTNRQLKESVKQVKESNAHLASELAKVNQEDATAIDEGLKHEDNYKDAIRIVNEVADKLETEPDMLHVLKALDMVMMQAEEQAESKQPKRTLADFFRGVKLLL